MYQISLKPRSQVDFWRAQASYWHLSPAAKQKLEWIIFYQTAGKRKAKATASYFSISTKTFHKWKSRFDPARIHSLEEKSRAPLKRRVWQVTPVQEARIIALREKHLKYGKKKLKLLYQQEFKETISTWKIERVVRKHQLFADPTEHKRAVKRCRQSKPKRRITELAGGYQGTLWHTDSIVLWWYGQRRIIFTALEDKTKLGYARVYQTNSSRKAKDFLEKLVYLSSGDIHLVHSDNGSEFAGEFERACKELGIDQVYSRVRTPKDNPALERFNWTVQDEWLSLSEAGLDDIEEANIDLTDWLVEYNFKRPHQALDYQTPIAYAFEKKVLPMSPASTSI